MARRHRAEAIDWGGAAIRRRRGAGGATLRLAGHATLILQRSGRKETCGDSYFRRMTPVFLLVHASPRAAYIPSHQTVGQIDMQGTRLSLPLQIRRRT